MRDPLVLSFRSTYSDAKGCRKIRFETMTYLLMHSNQYTHACIPRLSRDMICKVPSNTCAFRCLQAMRRHLQQKHGSTRACTDSPIKVDVRYPYPTRQTNNRSSPCDSISYSIYSLLLVPPSASLRSHHAAIASWQRRYNHLHLTNFSPAPSTSAADTVTSCA